MFSWGITPKIGQLDSWLLVHKKHRANFREVHPEVSFAHWRKEVEGLNSPSPFLSRKKRSQGKKERGRLIGDEWTGAVEEAIDALGVRTGRWSMDDLHDAFACLWTARRLASGRATLYPSTNPAPEDQEELGMVIHA